MAIISKKLAEGGVNESVDLVVELVEDGSLHCHLGKLRVDMSKEEFREFADSVSKAKNSLEQIKNGI
jgi:hypothetical protein